MKKFLITLTLLIGVANFSHSIERYIVTFEIRQSTMTLDAFHHISNKTNTVEFTIATDKETYDAVSVGQDVSYAWHLGSLVLYGDFSKLKIIVKHKEIRGY